MNERSIDRKPGRLRVDVVARNKKLKVGFGCYRVGSAKRGKADVRIDFSAIFNVVADPRNGLRPSLWKELTADVIVHELLHAVQDILGRSFSEREVNAAIKRARSLHAH